MINRFHLATSDSPVLGSVSGGVWTEVAVDSLRKRRFLSVLICRDTGCDRLEPTEACSGGVASREKYLARICYQDQKNCFRSTQGKKKPSPDEPNKNSLMRLVHDSMMDRWWWDSRLRTALQFYELDSACIGRELQMCVAQDDMTMIASFPRICTDLVPHSVVSERQSQRYATCLPET